MALTHKYLDWDIDLIPQIKENIFKEVSSKSKKIDLSHLLIIVPTKRSGENLANYLINQKKNKYIEFKIPSILTPLQFLENTFKENNLASTTERLFCWVKVIKNIKIKEIDAVFNRLEKSDSWTISCAKKIYKLRESLIEKNYDLNKLNENVQNGDLEKEKWTQLAKLEKNYYKILKSKKISDLYKATEDFNSLSKNKSEFSKIIIAATPDPKALPLKIFKKLERQNKIEVWINGPKKENLFDRWGIPIVKNWKSRNLEFNKWNYAIEHLENPNEISKYVLEEIKKNDKSNIKISILDKKIRKNLNYLLCLESVKYYDPEGLSFEDSNIGTLIIKILEKEKILDLNDLKNLLYNPYIQNFIFEDVSLKDIFCKIDYISQKKPDYNIFQIENDNDLDKDYHFIKRIVDKINSVLIANDKQKSFAENLNKKINIFTNSLSFLEEDLTLKDLKDHFDQLISDNIICEKKFNISNKIILKEILLNNLSSRRVYKIKGNEVRSFTGWLEFLWSDSSKILLCGLNQGIVPKTIESNALLSEKMISKIGIECNEKLLSIDTYLFECLTRRNLENKENKIKILISKADIDGNRINPSKILFKANDAIFLKRIKQFYINRKNSYPLDEKEINLSIPKINRLILPNELSITSLKDYLACPFRFYLKNILDIKNYDLLNKEMSPMQFGIFLHEAMNSLEGMKISKSTSASKLNKILNSNIVNHIKEKYGNNLSFALHIQKENLLERIRTFTKLEINSLKEKEEIDIISTEKSFRFTVNKTTIKGRIDRIDYLNKTMRIIDYKTSSESKNPISNHLKLSNPKIDPPHLPKEAYVKINNKMYYWTNLQLPLYYYSEYKKDQTKTPKLIFYNITPSLSSSSISEWDTFDNKIMNSALECCEAIVKKISKADFWPPNENIPIHLDEYSKLFPNGIKQTIKKPIFI